MTISQKLKEHDKWILGIGIAIASMIFLGVFIWMQTHLTMDFLRIDEVREYDDRIIYTEFKELK